VTSTPVRLRPSVIALAGIAAMLVMLAALPATASADAVSREVAARVNAFRAQHGLHRLAVDGRLERAARWQSGSMRARQSLSHGAPSGKARLTRLCSRMHAKTVGETIGWIRYRSAAKQAEAITRWWMNSPPHRAALMSGSFKRIGVGRRIGRFGGQKVVWFTADLSG